MYVTLSSGELTIFTAKKNGKSKKRAFGLHGSAVGLVKSHVVDGRMNCFRVLDGMESIILQAESEESMYEWATSIALSISMESGGGLLLQKEKRCSSKTTFESNNVKLRTSSIFRKMDKSAGKKPTAFAEISARIKSMSSGDEYGLDSVTEAVTPIESLSDATEDTSLIITTPTSLYSLGLQDKIDNLGSQDETEATDELSTTFNSLEPVDLCLSMESFARNFFVSEEKPVSLAKAKTSMPGFTSIYVESRQMADRSISPEFGVLDNVGNWKNSTKHTNKRPKSLPSTPCLRAAKCA